MNDPIEAAASQLNQRALKAAFNAYSEVYLGKSTERVDAVAAAIAAYQAALWQPIETAPKGMERWPVRILLGFAPDEERHSLPSCEGWWRDRHFANGRLIADEGWVTSSDSDVTEPYLKPTHWQPLPEPPKETK